MKSQRPVRAGRRQERGRAAIAGGGAHVYCFGWSSQFFPLGAHLGNGSAGRSHRHTGKRHPTNPGWRHAITRMEKLLDQGGPVSAGRWRGGAVNSIQERQSRVRGPAEHSAPSRPAGRAPRCRVANFSRRASKVTVRFLLSSSDSRPRAIYHASRDASVTGGQRDPDPRARTATGSVCLQATAHRYAKSQFLRCLRGGRSTGVLWWDDWIGRASVMQPLDRSSVKSQAASRRLKAASQTMWRSCLRRRP